MKLPYCPITAVVGDKREYSPIVRTPGCETVAAPNVEVFTTNVGTRVTAPVVIVAAPYVEVLSYFVGYSIYPCVTVAAPKALSKLTNVGASVTGPVVTAGTP
jgi:hypothetical protein